MQSRWQEKRKETNQPHQEYEDLFPIEEDTPSPTSETSDLQTIEEDNPPPTSETSDLQRMAFPVEIRRKTRVVKTEAELRAWLEIIEQQGYSMVDQHMRTLVPRSCFRALKNEKREEDRLVILVKENLVYSEHDILRDIYPLRQRKRARIDFFHHVPQNKRKKAIQTDDVEDIL
jgi:hypothetical protein